MQILTLPSENYAPKKTFPQAGMGQINEYFPDFIAFLDFYHKHFSQKHF